MDWQVPMNRLPRLFCWDLEIRSKDPR
jgi:hypothetical protein